jgi:membrane fusion protein (multidrug efflux system)
MRLNVFLVSLLLAAMVMVSCKGKKENKGKSGKERPPVVVDVMIAAVSDISAEIEVNGTVLSEDMVELRPEVSGRLTFLSIPDGALVEAGTVLARINDADLQAQLKQQQVQLELAEKTEHRLSQLLEVNGVDQASYDAALTQVNLFRANIDVLKAQIDKTVIRAPFTGTLGLRLVSQGAYVSPSTLIGTLQRTDRIKIDFSVPEVYGSLVKPGQTVEVRTTGREGKFMATVKAIEPQINTSTRNLKVRALINDPVLNPGAFVKVYLSSAQRNVVVPANAVIPDAMSNQVVLVKSGKAVYTDVETGIRNSNGVEIRNGIQAGDTLVVSGVLFTRPGAPLKVRKIVG